jgi:tRNA-binding protein
MHATHDLNSPSSPPITFDAFLAAEHYTPETLIGRQVAAVVNFPPRQVGKFMSEVLTLGFADPAGAVVLFKPDQPVPDGSRLF